MFIKHNGVIRVYRLMTRVVGFEETCRKVFYRGETCVPASEFEVLLCRNRKRSSIERTMTIFSLYSYSPTPDCRHSCLYKSETEDEKK